MRSFSRLLGYAENRYRRYESGESAVPVELLARIRKLTGLSLDWLVMGQPPGFTITGSQPDYHATAERLRWSREVLEASIDKAARLMGIGATLWEAYENGSTPLPLEVAREFSLRFFVSLDFLYDGRTEGVHPLILAELVKQHPELIPAQVRADKASRGSRSGPVGGGGSIAQDYSANSLQQYWWASPHR